MLLEFWKQAVDDKKAFGALLVDLSKVFDSLNHDLLIGPCLWLPIGIETTSRLSDCKQITNTGCNLSGWEKILGLHKEGPFIV